jgi:NitT/TauT family transport system substrate-binding protein
VWGTLYLLSNHPGISTFADLEGKTISVFGQGATPDILLQRYIEYNQLNAVKIDYSYSGNSDLAQALLQKKVKIAVLSEPLVSSLLARDSTLKMISKLDCEYFFHNSNIDIFAQTSFLVNCKYIEDYDAGIHKLTEAYAQSCNFVNEEPEKAIDLLLKHKLIMDRTEARIALPLCNIHYVGAFAVERELMEYLNIFYEYSPKSIGGKLPPRNIIYQP